jgi:4-hydroxy-2-oxoheptanedioate aldolase
MGISKNRFKAALEQDKVLFGMWMAIPNPTVAEIGAGAGFDWLLIDAEHGPFDIPTVMAHLQAIAAYPVAPIVRPVEGRTAIIKQMMDIGVQTLLVPMIDTAEQAGKVVRAALYPPQGVRGLGTSMARAAQWNRIPDYLHQANQEVFVIVQIETTEGLSNIEEIINTEGVGAVFIGPSDLSAAMGYVGSPEHPKVVAAVCAAIKTVRAAGKPAGVLAVTKDLVAEYTAAGANFIGVGADSGLLAKATRDLAATYIELGEQSDIAGY